MTTLQELYEMLGNADSIEAIQGKIIQAIRQALPNARDLKCTWGGSDAHCEIYVEGKLYFAEAPTLLQAIRRLVAKLIEKEKQR